MTLCVYFLMVYVNFLGVDEGVMEGGGGGEDGVVQVWVSVVSFEAEFEVIFMSYGRSDVAVLRRDYFGEVFREGPAGDALENDHWLELRAGFSSDLVFWFVCFL